MKLLADIVRSGREIELSDLAGLTSREIHRNVWMLLDMPSIAPHMISELGLSKSWIVRKCLCSHPSVSDSRLKWMMKDTHPGVRSSAMRELEWRIRKRLINLLSDRSKHIVRVDKESA